MLLIFNLDLFRLHYGRRNCRRMCGIFGIIAKRGSTYSPEVLRKALYRLALLSETRGKDSSGICFRNEKTNKIEVLKGDIPISDLMKKRALRTHLSNCISFSNGKLQTSFCTIGHARLVTNGTQLNPENNQPVIKDGIIGIHNGIIVNNNELWDTHNDLKRKYEIDTEVMLSITRKYLGQGLHTTNAVAEAIKSVFGTVATVMLFEDKKEFVMATNNGALYILSNGNDILCFASEFYILQQLIEHHPLKKQIEDDFFLEQVPSNSGWHLDIDSFGIHPFTFDETIDRHAKQSAGHNLKPESYAIELRTFNRTSNSRSILADMIGVKNISKFRHLYKLLDYPWDKISKLKRCTKCILPQTFPFINFDKQGVCNYCNNYQIKNKTKHIDELAELVEPYRKSNGQPDVLIPFSGGRDSTYTLHLIKTKLRLNPIAFTYDWGMVTDLARRNIARVCGKLGVENIIVAADIRWKRENIRKNIAAWLSNPHLGMIPLFMAGDKFFFYYTNKVKIQNNIRLNIWGINYLENTNFKTGFAGISPQFKKKNIYSLSMIRQLKLFGFVAIRICNCPGYINQSLLDNLGSFASRYVAPKRDYFNMFDFYQWDENEIETLVKDEYRWETAIDTQSTWRIGDGTASFYNYIYTTVAGFCENDTFRSNQIRENMLSRERALKLIENENQPRFSSLKWYLDIVGLDFISTIRTINHIPKLYA